MCSAKEARFEGAVWLVLISIAAVLEAEAAVLALIRDASAIAVVLARVHAGRFTHTSLKVVTHTA